MRVASKVGNLRSEFEHAGPSGSPVIRYIRDGRTDRRTDKSKPYCPIPTGGGIIITNHYMFKFILHFTARRTARKRGVNNASLSVSVSPSVTFVFFV